MKARFKPAELVGIAAVIVVGVIMFRMSWLKAPDILVDFGRELYVPWQLSEGKLLYRDLYYWNGPLTPYLNAFAFRLFGVSVHTLLAFNTLIIAAITFFIYKLFKEADDALSSVVASIIFLSLFAFAQFYRIGGYNFAAPYSHELSHGILISLAAIYLLKVYLDRRTLRWVFFIGLFVGLAFLTKLEIIASISVASTLGLLLTFWCERPSKERLIKAILCFSAGFFLPIILALMIFSFQMPFADAFKGLMRSWYIVFTTDVETGAFQRRLMGFNEIGFNAWRLFISLLWYLIIFLPIAVLAYLFKRERPFGAYIKVLAAVIAALVTGYFIKGIWSEILRPLPLFISIISVIFFIIILRNRDDNVRVARLIPELTLIVFSLMMMMKMLLKVHVAHYGFALAMLATLVLVKMLTYYLPRVFGAGNKVSSIFRWAALSTVAVVVVFHVMVIREGYERKQYAVASGSDKMIAYGPELYPYGETVNATIKEIERSFAPDATFVALPEGATLNFLSRRRNPSGFMNFVPCMFEMFGEEMMLDTLKSEPPDYILYVHMDTTECGYRFLGKNYGFKTKAWIDRYYTPVYLAGAMPYQGNRFGILIVKRNEGLKGN
ncbi:MAG: glycosyltransferase family 39 protein [Thermodesulfobacteriota bacterium]